MTIESEITGEELKQAGISSVVNNNADWVNQFNQAALTILNNIGEVTSEDVINVVGMPSGHPNAVGGAMARFGKRNGLRIVHHRKSLRPSCHSAIIGVWRPTLRTATHCNDSPIAGCEQYQVSFS